MPTDNRCRAAEGCTGFYDPRSRCLGLCQTHLIDYLQCQLVAQAKRIMELEATRDVHVQRIIDLNRVVMEMGSGLGMLR
jgi:hypothetical protein